MPRESRRQSYEGSDRRKPDRERDRDPDRERDTDRDRDRRRDRDVEDTHRRRESDSNYRTRSDYAPMPNPPSFTNMPYAAPSSPPRQYSGPYNVNTQGNQRRRAPSNSSYGSSSSSSVLDISRHYPQSRYGGFLGTFFKAPSERRRRNSARRAARSSKRRTSFYFGGAGNSSSSSSVNSDLAYGYGYIPKLHRRRRSSRRDSGGSNSFRYGGAAAAASGSGPRSARTRDGDVPDAPPSRRPDGHGPTTTRGKTDEEILDIGRQLSDLARKQNKHDLKAAGYVKPTMLAAAAAAGLGKYRKSRNEARSRGVGSSRIHGESSSDESDWEDASDDESDGADSVLAYGSVVSSAVRPTAAAGRSSYGAGPYASGAVMGGAGAAAAAAAALTDPQRRSSVVDPRLFGPVNSLRGMINTPCGFGQDPHPAPPPVTYQTPADARRNGAEPLDRRPMREVYPVPTSDPSRFDADAIIVQEELPHRSHTSTVPLEQPVPKLPVSSKVYEADKLEDSSRRESRHGKDRDSLVKDRDSYAKDRDSHGFNGSTVAGFAAAAIGATGVAALASDRKEDKKEKKALRERERERERDKEREREDRERERAREKDRNRDKEREQERERDRDRRDRDRELKRRDKDSDKEGKKSKRDSYSSSKYDEKDHKRHSKHADEDTPRKRRETEADHYADSPSSRKDRSKREIDEPRSELSRSSKRDSNSYSSRDDRKEDKGKSVDRYDFSYNQGTPSSKVNPFLYQVSDGAFSTTVLPAVEAPADRPLTPNIVTIDREPNFDDYEPYLPLEPSESRLSRKDSFEIQERPQDFQVHPKRYDHGIHVYEEGEHEASSIYDQAKHATIPVAAAAVASAIAVETERSRERRRGQYDEEGSRDRGSWRRDTVQEEADKYYRESVIARKIEEEQIRSRTPEDDTSRQVRIVTPPEMHEQHKNVGPYDAPNADVRIDNKLFPKEATKFDKKNGKRKSNFKSRDPSCERDRPVLNLVFPTPIPSREPTPRVERQTTRDQRETRTRSDPSAEVAIGPKGDIIKIEPSNKSVSWGENSTKSFEVESADGRSDAEKEKVVEPEDKPRVRLTRASPWSMVAAAVAGSGSEPSGKPDTVSERKYDTEDYSSKIPDIQEISQIQPEQVYNVDTRDQPPVPGPKPISPPRSTLPGSFADDVEFAATLAAGLKDTGFDSNIVVDDPTYRRRDSPPGTKEANGDEWNHKSMSDIVMDIANKKDSSRSVVSEPAGITRDRPVNDHSNGGDEWEAPKKLSKKDKKKLDKLKYQSLDSFEPINPTETINPDPAGTPAFEDAVEDLSKLSKKEQKRREKQAKALSLLEGGGRDAEAEPAAEPEIVCESVQHSYPTEDTVDNSWEDSSSKKKKNKDRKSQEMAAEESITVPTDAFDDLQSLRKLDKDDTVSTAIEEWDTPSKSKRKSKSDKDDTVSTAIEEWDTPSKSKRKSKSDRDESTRSVAESELSTSSKKSSKSKRRSGTEGDFDGYGSDRSKKSSRSKHREGEDGYGSDVSKKSSKSKRRSGTEGDFDGYGSDRSKKSSRSKHREGDDGYGSDRSKKSSRSKHREGDDGYGSDMSRKSSKSKRRSGAEGDFDYGSDIPSRRRSLFDDRDVSSVVSEARGDGRRREREKDRDRDRDRDRDGRSSSKRSSRNYDDDDDARSVVSVASAPGGIRKSKDSKRSSGLFASIFKRDDDKKEKESFLDNAGTLGAGVGLAGAAAIVAASVARSNATDRSGEAHKDDDSHQTSRVESYDYDTFDPEIAPRAIKPAIDPQYGDLLPLPPSEPGSPRSEPGDFPPLPDSRPDTPPEEHGMRRDQITHRRRRSTQETPVKSPSNTAIPLSLRLGQRPPSSPSGTFKSPPTSSSAQTSTAPDSTAKRASRGTSWDSSREFKPLYLLEHSRHGSAEAIAKQEHLPALPPSISASEISLAEDNSPADFASSGLHIDTQDLPHSFEQHGGSQETTPKAEIKPQFPTHEEQGPAMDPNAVDSMSKDRSSYLLDSTPSSTKTTATLDSELSQSDPGSTPSKHRRSADIMPEITEDLTSADERFEDALDMPSAGSHRWSDDSVAMQDASEHHELAPDAELLTKEASAPAEESVAEPDEWAGLSAKQKKKLKKAKKAQSLNLSEPTAEPAAEPTAEPASDPVSDSVFEPAFEITSEPAPDSTSAPLSESVPVVGEPVSSMPGPVKDTESASPQGEAFEGPKKSKKGKKNKKKSQSLENDALEAASIVAGAAALGATVLATQPADNTESAADPQPDTKLVPSSEATDNHSVAEKYGTEPSSPTEAIDNNTCVADPMPDTEFSSSADTSKNLHTQTEHGLTEGKGLPTETEPSAKEAEPQELLTKTNDESTKSQQLDIQPEVDSKSLEELNTKELLEQETSLPLKELAAQATPVEAEIAPEPQPDKTEDITADATDEWSTTSKVSKKDKKKKKKKSLVLDDVSPEPEPAAEAVQETPIATELEDNALSAKEQTTDITPTEATASSEPQLEKAEGTSVDAGDWWTSSASKSDKKKKKNRKQSVMLDDVPAEPEPAPEAKIEIPMVGEDEGNALATEFTASTTNVEQNQPEHSLADLAADPPTEAADTKTVDADAAWPVSTTSKKDKKKKKKSSLSIIDNAISAEEPASTTDDQPSVVKDTGKIESVSDKEPEQPAVLDVYNEKETSINPEDEFAVTPQDKKKKKKGKRKSVHFEPEPIFSPEPSFSPEEEVPAPEDQPKTSDAQDDAAVPTLSTQDTIVSAQDTVFDETRQDLTSADTTQTDSQPPTDLQNDTLDPDKKDEKDTSQDALSLVNDSASDKKETVSSKQIELHDVTLNTATAESDKNLDSIDVTPATVTAEGREKPDLADVTSAVATDKTEAESEDEWSRLISGNKAKEPEGDIVLASGLTDEPETIIDVSGMPNEDSEFEPKKETPSPTEPPLEEWPVATGKKGKKGKKNKKSTSSVSWGEPEAQLDTSAPTESTSVAIPEPETLSKSIDAEASMSRDLIAAEANEPITEQPAAEAPDEPAASDADILIPAKMSKKDKKKKKLAVLQEAFVDTPKDATEVETAVPVDEMPVEPLDGGAETVKEESVEQADPVAPTLEPAPELESVPAQQEKTNQDDGSDEIVSKLSKKDKKKKKKKQASMDEPKDEPAGLAQPDEAVQITEPVLSTESVLPTTEPVLSTELVESAESVQPSSVESTESIRAIEPQAIEPVTLTDPETHQAVSEAQVEAALETSAEQSSRESEQANTDKEPDGFSAKLSKKDKKKKKKKQSASAETEAATFEPLIPALGLEPQADILEPAASLDSQSGDAIYPQQENVDDDSGAFATKSAKGDKQSETGQSVQTDAPQDNVSPVEHDPLVKDDQPAEESAPETAALVTSVETNPTQAEVEPTVKMSKPESISQAATTVEPETEWGDLNTKLSKKDKKKAKKAAKEAISRTPEETLVEEPATEKTVEQPFDAVIATDSVEKPIESTEPSPQATTPEVESEKELSGLARKSSKKDKKKKKKSLSQAFSAFTDEAAAQGADETPAEPVAEADVSKPDEMNSEPVAEPVIEPVIEPVSEPVAEPVVAPDAEPPAVTIAKLASDAPPGETKTEDVLGGLNNDLPEDKEKEGREQEATSETIELNPEVPAIESPKAEIQEIVPAADEKPDVKEVEPDNSWMAGLSKKEQKKLKKKGLTAAALGAAAAATGASMLVAETPETARDPEPRPPQDVKDEFNSSSASGTSETEARQFTANKMSKAEKKKAKKLGLKMYDIGESEPTTEEVGAPGSTAERLARELPPSEQPKSSWAEEMADNDWSPAAEVKERDPKTDTVVPAEEPAAAESAFSTSAPTETESRTTEDDKLALPIKKGKKGKKAKRQSTLDVDLETVPTEQPAEVPASIEPETAREDPVSEQTREFEVEWPAPEAEAAAAQGDAESARNMTPMEPSKADQPISLTTLETVEEDLRPESGPSFAEETITAPVAESPAEVADDDWAAPTRKKSKKGKKGKSAPLSDFEDTASKGAESVPDSAQVSTQPEPVPVVEDEWGTTAKKGKGKKGKKMSLLAWEDSIVEPSSSTVPVEAENAHTPVAITDNESAFVEEPAAIPDAAVQDKDDWAAPVKKKSKKDKKRQSTQESYTEAEAPTKSDATRDNDAAKESKRDDATTIGDERQERRFEEAVSVGEVERDDLPKVEMTRSVDDKFSSSDKKMTTKESLGAAGGGKKTAGRDSLEAVGAAAALTGGVAALAQMYGGGKKKKGKKSKIVDKRQPQGDDLFDDPAVWEGPDKKNVVEESRDETLDDGVDEFWGPSRPDPGPSVAPHTPVSTSFTESGDEWKETARQGVSVDDEFVESPILGRGDSVLPRSTPAGLLRRDTKPEEPAGGPFDEAPRGTPSRQLSTELSEVRSSPTRALPAVQELPEAEKLAATGDLWPMEQANRDSGFIPESPPRRRSPGFVDEKLRDSGVDSGDWREPLHMQTPEAHGRAMDKRLGPSPLNTPVLQEPPRDKTTTPVADPDKKLRRSNKDYGGLAAVAAGSAVLTAEAAHHGKGCDNDRRAVSDSHAAIRSGRAESTDSVARRSVSNTSLSRQRTPEPLKLRPESPGSILGQRSTATPTPPPLRRVDKRMSGDLRALRQQNNSTPPVANEARVRTKDMADVYDGFGEGRLGSPRSPTRPHSMRRRQSMQVLELESRVDQLLAENRLLTEARNQAEQNANRSATSVLSERDAEIDALKQSLQYLQNEVNRLTEVNEGLTSANAELANKDNTRYAGLAVHGDGTRSLEGPDGAPIKTLEEKDAEIASLREQLEAAKEQVREMQRQILASKAADAQFLNIRDEDYFDNRCQQLCSHVQQWVLRFSKFSDMRACRLTSEINDEKTIDRLDNAVLDGSDVDIYLNDRVKRRDIFMSMTMSMIWEFVFTRYLFGMDREQRQKLKSLEKLLTEVGPQNAVRQWRAVTLTLLAKRASFQEQRELDTEAVVQAIFQTLCKILPPPSNLENQIQSQLRRVMREAVDLSIAMRTQQAEYMMLPPLQPEYDADGELAATVQFNASMMNERNPQNKQTNEEIEADNSIVRIVLFPLVVKKGDDAGVGDDEIVVCPAQVLVAREHGRRHVTPSSDAGGASLLGAPSRLSVVTDAMLSQADSHYVEGRN